jgi:hypothetical protein
MMDRALGAAIMPLDQAANGSIGPGETLLLIDIINAEGRLIVQTLWEAMADRG